MRSGERQKVFVVCEGQLSGRTLGSKFNRSTATLATFATVADVSEQNHYEDSEASSRLNRNSCKTPKNRRVVVLE